MLRSVSSKILVVELVLTLLPPAPPPRPPQRVRLRSKDGVVVVSLRHLKKETKKKK